MSNNEIPSTTTSDLKDGHNHSFHQNHSFHRNGVSGKSFKCWIMDGVLGVKFSGEPEADTVSLETLAEMVKSPALGPIISAAFRPGVTQAKTARMVGRAIVFAYLSDGENFVAIFRPDLSDIPFATFNFEKLIGEDGVHFGKNSWRGDSMADSLLKCYGGWTNINDWVRKEPNTRPLLDSLIGWK